MIDDVLLGFKTFFQAIKFVGKHRLNYFYLFPLLLSVAMSWVFFKFKSYLDDWMIALIKDYLGMDLKVDMAGWGEFIIYWLLTISVFFIWIKINRYIVLILLSPMLSILSEITEVKLTGKKYPFSLSQLFKDIWRGSLIAIKNIGVELFLMFACWVLVFFFPPIGAVTIPFLLLLSWYYMGFSFLDYNYERRKLSVWQGSQEVWRRKGVALVHGGLFILLAYIPVVGVMVGSVWCTVASALAVNADEQKQLAENKDGYLDISASNV